MKKTEIFDMKAAAKNRDKYKGYFGSNGYSEIKVTKEGKVETLQIPIRSVSPSHPIVKEFVEKFPIPEAPAKRVFMNRAKGLTLESTGKTIKEVMNEPGWDWCNVFDETDKKYNEARNEWSEKQSMIMMMIIFDLTEEFGIDKLKQFGEFLQDLGITGNQFKRLADDIKNLDS